MRERDPSFLRKQAWDYFSTHASQRLTTFNFYIVLSSAVTTTYFAAFRADSNLQTAKPVLAGLLCLFSFVFWKLDQRNRFLIKNAEAALKHFEKADPFDTVVKVFTQEEISTTAMRQRGWRKLIIWRNQQTYSNCFNTVFVTFFLIGASGLVYSTLKLLS